MSTVDCGHDDSWPNGICRTCVWSTIDPVATYAYELERRGLPLGKVLRRARLRYVNRCRRCGASDWTARGTCRPCKRQDNQRYYYANQDDLLQKKAVYDTLHGRQRENVARLRRATRRRDKTLFAVFSALDKVAL